MIELWTWIEDNWASILILLSILGVALKASKFIDRIDRELKALSASNQNLANEVKELKASSETNKSNIDKLLSSLQDIKDDTADLKDKIFHLSSAQKISLHDRLKHLSDRYISRHEITLEDKVDFQGMYDSYKKDLNANGDMKIRYDLVMSLPVVEEYSENRR